MSNDAQSRQPAGSPASGGGQFAESARPETGTAITTPDQKNAFEADVQRIAGEQGWSTETVGEMAFEFMLNASEEREQALFLTWLRECADNENAPDDEDVDYESDAFNDDDQVELGEFDLAYL